jgi:hypothetical protein
MMRKAFHLDIDSLTTSGIWVREDYTRLYGYYSKYSAEVQNDQFQKAPSIIVTGQLGVGECFSSYIHSSLSNILLKGENAGSFMPYAAA